MTQSTARSSVQTLDQFQQEAQQAMQRIQKDRLRSTSLSPDEQVQRLYNHVEEITILFSDYVQWASTHQQEAAGSSSSSRGSSSNQ